MNLITNLSAHEFDVARYAFGYDGSVLAFGAMIGLPYYRAYVELGVMKENSDSWVILSFEFSDVRGFSVLGGSRFYDLSLINGFYFAPVSDGLCRIDLDLEPEDDARRFNARSRVFIEGELSLLNERVWTGGMRGSWWRESKLAQLRQ